MDRRQGQGGRVMDRMAQVRGGGSLSPAQQGRFRSHLTPPQRGAYLEHSQHEERSGQAYRAPAYPASPPTAIPSLSSGQGFYTVESLLGATTLPPPTRMPALPFQDMGGYRRGNPGLAPKDYPDMLVTGRPAPYPVEQPGVDFDFVDNQMYNGPGGYPERPPSAVHHISGPGPVFGWPREWEQGRDRQWGWDERREYERQQEREPRVNERFPDRGPAKKVRPFPKKLPPQPAKHIPIPGSKLKKKPGTVTGPGGAGWCALCEVECNTADMLRQHLAGKRHRRNVVKLDTDSEAGPLEANGSKSMPTGTSEQVLDSGKRNSTLQSGSAHEDVVLKKPRLMDQCDKANELSVAGIASGMKRQPASTSAMSQVEKMDGYGSTSAQPERDKNAGNVFSSVSGEQHDLAVSCRDVSHSKTMEAGDKIVQEVPLKGLGDEGVELAHCNESERQPEPQILVERVAGSRN